MKAIIEGKLKTMLITTVEIYVEVLNAIIDSNNEQELRNNMNEIEERYNSWKGDLVCSLNMDLVHITCGLKKQTLLID